jgi:hypothetical protein
MNNKEAFKRWINGEEAEIAISHYGSYLIKTYEDIGNSGLEFLIKKLNDGCNMRIKEKDKFAELKKAQSQGKIIQYWSTIQNDWVDCWANRPSWNNIDQYRVKPDKFAELKKAYDEGKTIQMYMQHRNKWVDCTPIWVDTIQYRVKPEPDKFAELNKAYREGKQIQYWSTVRCEWVDCTPVWNECTEYRIKPEYEEELEAITNYLDKLKDKGLNITININKE